MILLVDLGNSRVKWADFSGGKRGASTAVAYERPRVEQALDTVWLERAAPEGVVLCSVAGRAATDALRGWITTHWHCPVRELRSSRRLDGIENAYPEPERLGVDRLVAMVGARAVAHGPVCVLDVGTAMTLDAVAGDGRHLGGLIAAGPDMLLTALGRTGDILVERQGNVNEFATATPDAVVSGVVLGTVALVVRFVEATRRRLGENVTLVVTGGAADRILPELEVDHHLPDLVLDGLAVIAEEDSQ